MACASILGNFVFAGDGRFIAWSNSDGTVDVADVEELRHLRFHEDRAENNHAP